jgi:hypothetical protein
MSTPTRKRSLFGPSGSVKKKKYWMKYPNVGDSVRERTGKREISGILSFVREIPAQNGRVGRYEYDRYRILYDTCHIHTCQLLWCKSLEKLHVFVLKICSSLHFIILKKINSKSSDGNYYISYFHVNSYCMENRKHTIIIGRYEYIQSF